MEIQNKKCSFQEHENLNANCYCIKCEIYMCNKCEIMHSKLLKNHKAFILEKNNEEVFTGLCKEENHNNKLQFFCKNHNQLCCAVCLCKIQMKEIGKHKDCDVCIITEIKDEKKNNLQKNIDILSDLLNNLEESINNLKLIIEKINENKEQLKLNIQKIFTKIRNSINNREEELLLEVDNIYKSEFFDEEIIKESEKLPNQIKMSLEKGKIIDKEWNDDNLSILINDCINIENNIKNVNIINEKIKKCNNSNNSLIKINLNEDEINKFLETIKIIGQIDAEKKDLLKFSSILKNDINNQNLILNWIKEKTNKDSIKFEKIFQMSENGSNYTDFHNYCDDKGPTLLLIKTTENRIFGGFTPLNWKTKQKGFLKIYDESNQTFIFSLNLMKKFDMINPKEIALKYVSEKGPIFGDHDFGLLQSLKKGDTYANNYSNFLSNNNLELTGNKGDNEFFETEEF